MRSALGFLTVLGRPGAPPAGAAWVWFGPVGAFVGALVGLAGWGAAQLWPPLVAGAWMVAVDAGVTGLLHLDGLADTGDGLLPPLPRERRLAVMAAPDIGAFGLASVVVVLVLRVAAAAALVPLVDGWRLPVLIAGWWAASRTVMAVAALRLPPARPGGMAATLAAHRTRRTLVAAGAVGAAVTAAAVAAGGGWAGVAGVAGLLIAASAVLGLAWRRLGGVTGDVLGAAGVVGETAALLAGSARW